MQGHAIECRINAENPDRNFAPCPGLIDYLMLPAGGLGVRVDTAVYEGYEIPPYYDSMIAKVIVHGKDRKEAISKMKRALYEFIIQGIDTNIEFQNRILISELDGGKTSQNVSFEELHEDYNSDVYSPVDGKIVRLADHLSALIEAASSIKYGITSRQLTSGRDNILKMYLAGTKINGIDAVRLFWSLMEL